MQENGESLKRPFVSLQNLWAIYPLHFWNDASAAGREPQADF